MTTKITEQNISNLANAGIQWQAVITSDGSTATTAVAGRGYFIDTTSNAHTINLPASAIAGDTIAIKDYAGTFGSNNLTIGRNGNNIQGVAGDSIITTNRASIILVYIDATKGWLYTNESNVADLEKPSFVTATGGTVTTSGNDKIHTFTGDGCFVVSGISTVSSNNKVGYLVVAGGGGGGGPGNIRSGGGGAGGFREGRCGPVTPYTDSPLSAAGLTVGVSTYPITVGGGGAFANNGSNSVFSTITSAGGGYGARHTDSPASGGPGGSGGGASSLGGTGPLNGGTGNTPPVSPPQGQNGGTNSCGGPGNQGDVNGGGGGAGEVGQNANIPGLTSGRGGAGVATHITGSPVSYAGGGGGGGRNGEVTAGAGSPCGTGGAGGGHPSGSPYAGDANTGGGGGGTTNTGDGGPSIDGGAGGKGIVIIRYKFQ